tara:strand:+ start:368 stop:517 length:150 start_codon:yes stop_codon:yes gene_type:complete
MKVTQLTPEQIDKIVIALELTYGDESNYDSKAMKLANQISKAKAVITTK